MQKLSFRYPLTQNIAAGVIVAAVHLAWSVEAGAVIYRWTDADGKLHLSDEKPRHQDYGTVAESDLPPVHMTPAPVVRPAEKPTSKPVKKKKTVRKKTLDCTRYEKKLATIKRKLWSGYKEPGGNKLRAQRREYRALLRNCKKNL
ncbi:DUF4124 domain-containing protein [Exilibacterium tricleocarpae]|nr:DUF4124 domain-containing protein [Exilibacterium tricleocarpae]